MCSLEPASARCVGLAGGLALGPVSSVASGLRDRILTADLRYRRVSYGGYGRMYRCALVGLLEGDPH